MNIVSFKESLAANKPHSEASPHLKALWYDAKGEWDMAHTQIQDIEDNNASWIHAYLHRKEGDIANAGYWYRRAGRKMPDISLEKEWENMVEDLINGN
jgi:hypothetical protein